MGSEGSEDDLPSRTGPGKIVNRYDAVELTTAVDGAAVLADMAGAVAPADLAGTDFRLLLRCIPRPLILRVILQLSVPVDSGALLA